MFLRKEIKIIAGRDRCVRFFLRKYKQSFSLAQIVYAHRFQYSDEFKYFTRETGHKTNKIRECARENTSSRGSLSPQPGFARVWSGSGKTFGPCAPLIPAQLAQAATRR